MEVEIPSQCLKHVEDIRRHAPSTLIWGMRMKQTPWISWSLSKSGDSFLGLWELPKTFQVSIYLSNLSWPHKISFQPGCKGSSSLRVKVSIVDPPRDIFFSYWGHQKSIPTQNKDHRNVHNKILPCFFFMCESQKIDPQHLLRRCNFEIEVSLPGPRLKLQCQVKTHASKRRWGFSFRTHTQWFKVCCVLKKKRENPDFVVTVSVVFFFVGGCLVKKTDNGCLDVCSFGRCFFLLCVCNAFVMCLP